LSKISIASATGALEQAEACAARELLISGPPTRAIPNLACNPGYCVWKVDQKFGLIDW